MSKAKGRRTEKKAIDYLVENGHIVDKVELGGRFRVFKDFMSGYCLTCWQRQDDCCDDPQPFEGFDLVSVKMRVVYFLQIKTNQPVTQKNYKKFATKFASEHLKIQCMTWYDRRGWVIHDFLPNGKVKRIDLRK